MPYQPSDYVFRGIDASGNVFDPSLYPKVFSRQDPLLEIKAYQPCDWTKQHLNILRRHGVCPEHQEIVDKKDKSFVFRVDARAQQQDVQTSQTVGPPFGQYVFNYLLACGRVMIATIGIHPDAFHLIKRNEVAGDGFICSMLFAKNLIERGLWELALGFAHEQLEHYAKRVKRQVRFNMHISNPAFSNLLIERSGWAASAEKSIQIGVYGPVNIVYKLFGQDFPCSSS